MIAKPYLGPIVVASVLVLCAGQVANAQVDWSYQGPVVGPGDPGSWDDGDHAAGDVIYDPTTGTYHMYLIAGHGGNCLDNGWSVGHWTWNETTFMWDPDPCNPVLEPEPGQWDGYTICGLSVLREGGTFKMWYGAAAVIPGKGYGGYATNADGWCDWNKDPGNPLTGLDPGPTGAWDENGHWPSAVLFDGSAYHTWTTAGAGDTWTGAWGIGHATSPDGLVWTTDPNPVLTATEPWEEDKLYMPEVVKIGDSFEMLYSGLDMVAPLAQIGYAVSPDGVHWGKWPGNPVLSPGGLCVVVDSTAVIVEGDTIHGWVRHCDVIQHVTSPFEVLFFDDFESGDLFVWSLVVP